MEPYHDPTDGNSIYSKFKKNLGDGNKRQGFMELDHNRNGLIMTPTQQDNTRPSELDQSKGDLNNSSHYYRFKRHSVGYQSQGPSTNALKGSLLNMEAMHGMSVGREQSQTASGAGAFAGRGKHPAQVMNSPLSIGLPEAANSSGVGNLLNS